METFSPIVQEEQHPEGFKPSGCSIKKVGAKGLEYHPPWGPLTLNKKVGAKGLEPLTFSV
jgi:hypothetical protein